MNVRKFVWFFLATLWVCVFCLNGQEQGDKNPPPLQNEVVVTATRIETPVRDLASSVTVIMHQDLEKLKRTTIIEVLQDVCGVAIDQTGGPGTSASAFVRGANSEHVLILLDGVELNDPIDPSRSYDLSHLTLANVERIEILRGPQSTLYGSDALGGVINIVTRKGQGKPKWALTSREGSFATVSNDAELGGSTGALHYSFGLSQYSTGGIPVPGSGLVSVKKDGDNSLSLCGNFGLDLHNNFEANLTVRAVTDNLRDYYPDDVLGDPGCTQAYRSMFLKGQVRGLFAGNRWEQKLSLSFVRSDREYDDPETVTNPGESDTSSYKSGLVKLDWQNNLFLNAANTFTFGADLSHEQGESAYTSLSEYGPYTSNFPSCSADDAGFYLQHLMKLGGGFSSAAGVRLDDHRRTGWNLTFRIAPCYFLAQTQTKFKATVGTGFKSPSLYQLYAPPTVWGPIGNENLKAEKCTGWDAGIEQYFLSGKALLGVTYFRNDFRNLIDYNFSEGYINVLRARTRGVEIYGETGTGGPLRGRVSYTRLEATDLDTGAALLRRPRDKFTTNLFYTFLRSWNFCVSASYTGKREDTDFESSPEQNVTLAAYVLVNAVLSWDIHPGAQLFVRIDNILNAKYVTAFDYAMPGFAIYMGFKVGVL